MHSDLICTLVVEFALHKKSNSLSFEYFNKPSWGFASLIKRSDLARGIRILTFFMSGVLAVQKWQQ